MNDNKTSCKTMKSLRDKFSQFSRITLVDKDTIIIYNNKMQDDFQ